MTPPLGNLMTKLSATWSSPTSFWPHGIGPASLDAAEQARALLAMRTNIAQIIDRSIGPPEARLAFPILAAHWLAGHYGSATSYLPELDMFWDCALTRRGSAEWETERWLFDGVFAALVFQLASSNKYVQLSALHGAQPTSAIHARGSLSTRSLLRSAMTKCVAMRRSQSGSKRSSSRRTLCRAVERFGLPSPRRIRSTLSLVPADTPLQCPFPAGHCAGDCLSPKIASAQTPRSRACASDVRRAVE